MVTAAQAETGTFCWLMEFAFSGGTDRYATSAQAVLWSGNTYTARGVTTLEQLEYTLPRLAPVRTMSGIDAAVDLVLQHRNNRIVVVGDFDADGATSTALVIRCLRAFGFDETLLVPISMEDFDYVAARPLDSTLNTEKFNSATGFKPAGIAEALTGLAREMP